MKYLYQYREQLWEQAREMALELLRDMNGMSEQGIKVRLIHDPLFNQGYQTITQLFFENLKSKQED